ncbi:hypothetical protein ACXR0O_23400 [Verrucomicrobiota bacterium sgz303538]
MDQRLSKWLRGIVVGLVFLGAPAAVFLWPRESTPVSTHVRVYLHLRTLHRALTKFSEANANHLPASLAALEPEFVEAGFLDNLYFSEKETGNRYDWLYFPAAKLSSLSDDYILLATPKTIPSSNSQKVRVVLHPNGAVSDVMEHEFQQRIRTQASANGPK